MTLATRCPACGTVFRVVPDQLKVSDGWVRCGRCAEVFDASGALIDLDAPGSAIVVPPAAGGGSAGVVARAPGPAANDEATPATGRSAPAAAPSVAEVSGANEAAVAPATAEAAATRTDLVASEPRAEALRAESASAAPAIAGAASPEEASRADAAAPGDVAAPVAAETPVPGFVRRAERADRWRTPRRRALLAGAALGLVLALAAQIGLHARDRIAATWPATRPALQAACAAIGCRVEPPRRIDDLSVESSSLLRVDGTTLHRLQVVVRNRAATETRMPAVELSLTDSIGQTLARRVFDARELGVAAPSLPAQGEAALTGMLELSDAKVAGYTVELFYP